MRALKVGAACQSSCCVPANESAGAAPAGVLRVSAPVPTCVCVCVCEMPVGELVQYLCLSVTLACVADGLD